ncbi:MAG: dTDP-4-dehydrorhamnose reductase [Pyrinomonadaceae bacterium]
MRVLVTGAGGMVGRAVSEHCASFGDIVLSFDHQNLDISNREAIRQTLVREKPDWVINCAAWTDVDGCEFDPERAFAANARGPENLAIASAEIGSVLITISTDYVFDGLKEGFYTQDDKPNPQSAYATSKLEGERRAQLAYERSIVVRTGFVFGPAGKNFLSRVIERARAHESIRAITDAYGTPTYSRDLSEQLRELARLNVPGIYHVVNGGEGASFAEFTREALEIDGRSDVTVEEISMDSLRRPAKRPRNSRLRCLRSEAIGLTALRDWRSSLQEFVKLVPQPVQTSR